MAKKENMAIPFADSKCEYRHLIWHPPRTSWYRAMAGGGDTWVQPASRRGSPVPQLPIPTRSFAPYPRPRASPCRSANGCVRLGDRDGATATGCPGAHGGPRGGGHHTVDGLGPRGRAWDLWLGSFLPYLSSRTDANKRRRWGVRGKHPGVGKKAGGGGGTA